MQILFFPRFSDKLFYCYTNICNKKIKTRKFNRKKISLKFPKNFYIIVETNYRIYVYNDNKSSFLNTILLQFCDLIYNLPNLFVGELTKMSLNRAVKRGINSKSIVGFLEKNLHGVCNRIPYTVINQIRAWTLQYKITGINEYLIMFSTFQEKKKIVKWSIQLGLRKFKDNLNILKK